MSVSRLDQVDRVTKQNIVERRDCSNAEDVYETPRMRERSISVVIYTHFGRETLPKSTAETASRSVMGIEDDQTSVFSIAVHSALEESGDEAEFQRLPVIPKPKRRASSVHPARHRSAIAVDHARPSLYQKPRAKSCPAPVTREMSQPRDAKGRFARRSIASATPSTPKERSHARRSSSSGDKCSQPRDLNGRFARKSAGTSSTPVNPKNSRPRRTSGIFSETRSRSRDSKGQSSCSPSRSISAAKIPIVEIPQHKLPTDPTKKAKAKRSVPVMISAKMPQPEVEPPPAKKAKTKRPLAKSPFFPSPISPPRTPKTKPEKAASPTKTTPSKRSPAGLVSCIPFPQLSAPYFGLIQEKLAHDPFRLLIAVTFLIRTHGKHAIPVFYELMEKFATPESLAAADKDDIVSIIRHLGLQNSRAATYQTYAKVWLEDPPTKGRRYAVKDYPEKGSGRDVPRDEIIADDDPREAWEIGHMTSGPYALDSWRIFCRDILRGVAMGWNGEGAQQKGFQPEWMRVLPEDKELRAYLRWMWLKEGFEWNPFTGEKDVASPELMRAAIEGKIAWDDRGGMRILDLKNVETTKKVQGGLGRVMKDEIPDSEDERRLMDK